MNRDELLETCFGGAHLTQGGRSWFETLDETQQNVYCHVDLLYKRILVRTPPAPGPGFSDASAMLTVAAIANVCTDPDHRGKGFARRCVEDAHAEAATHTLVGFAALFAADESIFDGFYRKLGYFHPAGGPPGFYVRPLRAGEEWPDGPVDTFGRW